MNRRRLEIIFWLNLGLVLAIVFGFLPRQLILYWSVVLVIYFLTVGVGETGLFFVRSIPFFIALPLSAGFDSLNLWRILSLIIFLKWFDFKKIRDWFKFSPERKIYNILVLILLILLISILVANDKILALRRVIYFVNLSLIGIVIHDLISKSDDYRKLVIKNLAYPTIVVALLGFVQLGMTYFIDIFRFSDFWSKTAELNLFGHNWSEISARANTWFAYFGEQLSLRMFSIFPDSHSFPIFLFLGLPAVFALSLIKIPELLSQDLKTMIKSRGRLWVVFVPVIMLAGILSGTRGIWAAGIGVLLFIWFWTRLMKKEGVETRRRSLFRYIASYMSIFFLLFTVAFPIFASPQFLVSKDNATVLGKRFRSIIDAGETSNKRRLEIWRQSLESIIKKPIFGVGIGNFPVVVGEDLALAKAGSTAHNLYLNIAAEIGVFGLAAVLYFLWLLLKRCYSNFVNSKDNFLVLYYGAALIFLPWVLLYLLTDAALFDERAFLIFAFTCSLIFANKETAS